MVAMEKATLYTVDSRSPVVHHSREVMKIAVRQKTDVVRALERHDENANLRCQYDHKRRNKFAAKAIREYAAAQCALDGEQESLLELRAALNKLAATPPSLAVFTLFVFPHDQLRYGLTNLVTTKSERVDLIDTIVSFSPLLEAFSGSEPKDVGMKFRSEAGDDNVVPAKRRRDEDEEEGTRPFKLFANTVSAALEPTMAAIKRSQTSHEQDRAGRDRLRDKDGLKAEIKVKPSQELHEMINPEEKARRLARRRSRLRSVRELSEGSRVRGPRCVSSSCINEWFPNCYASPSAVQCSPQVFLLR
ncbi:hypothetical protein CcaverHIS002_0104690 [Cutaneotrichosporon cavernicola]|nr:hypothetical protein CcaverHIS002_0104690 [Cutaneotrichosporon cavernicola]